MSTSGDEGGLVWVTDEDGALHISGSGRVSINTTDGMKELKAVEGETELSFCGGCRNWLVVRDGETVHDDQQTVECVIRS